MTDAATKLKIELELITFNPPQIAVVNNVDVAEEVTGDAIKAALVKQLYSPVRWSETISLLANDGIEKVVEVGPGKVLQGLNKRINKSLKSVSFNTADSLQQAKDLINS